MEALRQKVVFSYMQKYDDTHSVIRFCTSWATKPEQVFRLAELL